MDMALVVSILIVLLALFAFWIIPPDPFGINNIHTSRGWDGNHYYVHRAHHDYMNAAHILAYVNQKVHHLIRHLKNKYLTEPMEKIDMNRVKNNHIDILPIQNDTNLEIERVEYLVSRYDGNNLVENSPHNADEYTSYTEGKGRKIAICLREKAPGSRFHDINLIMFVVIHELAHVCNDVFGHGEKFWDAFAWLLGEAVEAGIYKPVNYTLRPTKYCGMNINYSPLFNPVQRYKYM